MLKRLLGEINTKELFEHCSASQPGWHWVTSFWQNLVVGHETLSLVTWAPPGHCFSKLWTDFVAIFTILTPQPPVPSVWPLLPSGRWTDDSFLEFATNFFWQFFTGTEIKVSSCTGSSVWAHCAGNDWLFCVLMAPAPVATGWRLLENCSQGAEWVGHCHGPRLHWEGCAVSWGVSKLITRNTSTTPGQSQDNKYTL